MKCIYAHYISNWRQHIFATGIRHKEFINKDTKKIISFVFVSASIFQKPEIVVRIGLIRLRCRLVVYKNLTGVIELTYFLKSRKIIMAFEFYLRSSI